MIKENLTKIIMGIIAITVLLTWANLYRKIPEEELIKDNLISAFKQAEYSGGIAFRKQRDYISIVNEIMEKYKDKISFVNLEKEGMEINGIRSGIAGEIKEGYWVVITDEIVPNADAYSGSATMIFTQEKPNKVGELANLFFQSYNPESSTRNSSLIILFTASFKLPHTTTLPLHEESRTKRPSGYMPVVTA